ncbi:hypothetical protein Apa02nite_058210 [Actinoplanes palleronii]|uniref:Uncharacterized protein n=1 Tax=Actinoplanes palleronii TaxID=113570 RepID=A0ABQ4BG97_9ACTN|nr:hypothetical protein Apa02nite_058210 [Actinoplanes palleronii]
MPKPLHPVVAAPTETGRFRGGALFEDIKPDGLRRGPRLGTTHLAEAKQK